MTKELIGKGEWGNISLQIINMEHNNDRNFIVELILPLMGLSEEEINVSSKTINFSKTIISSVASGEKSEPFILENNQKRIKVDYFEMTGDAIVLTIDFINKIDDETFVLFECLFRSYCAFGKNTTDIYIQNALINEKVNELILQKGLFSYVLGDKFGKNFKIDDLFKCLQRWSEKTYEGHNVCYGFLINTNAPKEKIPESINKGAFGDFIDFIGEEYSAVFTDGITSIVEVNGDCDFIKYHSTLHDRKPLPNNLENVKLPIRFADIVYENVVDGKVGLFLLTNGDIIFAQKQAISFVRRGGRWLNFSHKAFYNTISSYVDTKTISRAIIEAIYCSCLDISFAHSGGLIAVIDQKNDDWINDLQKDNPIVTRLDTFDSNDFSDIYASLNDTYLVEKRKIDEKNLKSTIKKNLFKDLNKRLTKKRYLLQILKGNTYFPKIDRKLRADLSGLDGAIILNTFGDVIACGAIIANKAGSSGGGRGSAARTLSNYGGFAIKISTDGYIEAFVDESRIYSIK